MTLAGLVSIEKVDRHFVLLFGEGACSQNVTLSKTQRLALSKRSLSRVRMSKFCFT